MDMLNAPIDFPPRALWLWLPEENFPDRQFSPISFYTSHHGFTFTAALFRRTFTLERATRPLMALIAADCRFRIWLDGKYWCDGPPETGGDYGCQTVLPWAYFTHLELPDGLPKGEHRILAEVVNWSGLQSDYSRVQLAARMAGAQRGSRRIRHSTEIPRMQLAVPSRRADPAGQGLRPL